MTATKQRDNTRGTSSRLPSATEKRKMSKRLLGGPPGQGDGEAPLTYPARKRRRARKHITESAPGGRLDELAARELVDIFNEAVVSSRQQDRKISLTLDVTPDGQAWVTSEVEGQNDSSVDRTPIPEVARAMGRAQERGKHVVAEILSRSDMLSSDEMKELLGISRQAVNERRRDGKLLGLQGAKRQVRYPRWQVGDDGRPFAEIEKLFTILGSSWPVYRFLIQEHPELKGLSGIDALRQGRGEEAIKAAESQQQGNFS